MDDTDPTDELASAALDDELTADERARLDEAADAGARRADLGAARDLLAEPPAPLPSALREPLLDRALAAHRPARAAPVTPIGSAPRRRGSRRPGPDQGVQWVARAAAALILLGGGAALIAIGVGDDGSEDAGVVVGEADAPVEVDGREALDTVAPGRVADDDGADDDGADDDGADDAAEAVTEEAGDAGQAAGTSAGDETADGDSDVADREAAETAEPLTTAEGTDEAAPTGGPADDPDALDCARRLDERGEIQLVEPGPVGADEGGRPEFLVTDEDGSEARVVLDVERCGALPDERLREAIVSDNG